MGAPEAAETAYLKAAELSSQEEERARLTESAAEMGARIGADERALERFEAAAAAHRAAGRVVDAARVTAAIRTLIIGPGRAVQAVERLREALSSLEPGDRSPRRRRPPGGTLSPGPSSTWAVSSDAAAPIERALTLAQHNELTETYALALQIKAYLYAAAGRVEESILNQEGSLEVARKHDLIRVEARSQNLLTDLCMMYDRPGAEEHALAGLVIARRRGARGGEADTMSNLMYVLMLAGRWDESSRYASEVIRTAGEASVDTSPIYFREAFLDSLRGAVPSARQHFAHCDTWRQADDVQARNMYQNGVSALRSPPETTAAPWRRRAQPSRDHSPAASLSPTRSCASRSPTPWTRRSPPETCRRSTGSWGSSRVARLERCRRSSGLK